MFSRQLRPLLVFGTIFLSLAAVGRFAQQSYSANLTNVSVTLSNSRLSFRGALAAGNTEGSSQVTINGTPNLYASTDSAQLQNGDVINIIAGAASPITHTVTGISSATTFEIGTVLTTGETDTGDTVVATQSSTLTLGFTTQTAVASGIFQVLLPAAAAGANADGIPDAGYFDFGTTTPTVTCPSNATTTYDFYSVTNGNNGDATASAVTINGAQYHSYICAYSGTGAIGTAFSTMTIAGVINPAPKTNHVAGTADTHKPIIRHLNMATTVIDQTTVSIGVLEAVRVTATVAPLITFKVLGVASGTSACGTSTGVTTTATAVPFGEILIDSFTNAAQALTVSTNAADGYAVTAKENDQLSRNNTTCTGATPTSSDCIVDAIGDSGTMDYNVINEWSATTVKGFGYSLHNVNATGLTAAFQYNTSSGVCDGTGDCFRQFADAEVPDPATSIFSHTDVADNHNLYVCYRVVVSATQAAGDYENYITYTATANF